MSKTLNAVKALGLVILFGLSPVGILLYFALVYESIAAMVILGIGASVTLMILGATITLVGQHVHSKLNASQMSLNMEENSALMRAYSSAMSATANVRKADIAIQKNQETVPEAQPTLIIDNDAFSELSLPFTEVS